MTLVTGGAGFLGAALVRRLSAAGERVRVLDDFSAGRRERVVGLPRVEVREGDIRDPAAVRTALAGVDRVAHLAAHASRAGAAAEPQAAARVNIGGTLVLLGESRRARVSRFVYASSSGVAGAAGGGPIPATASPRPASVLAITKLAGERHVLLHHESGGPPAVALRLFHVYGPGRRAEAPGSEVLSRFAAAARSGRRPRIHGDGRQRRDFVFVGDAVDALRLALDAAPGPAGGEVFEVGGGCTASLLDAWRLTAAAAGVALTPRFGPPRSGEDPCRAAETGKASALLGFRAKTGLAEGIGRLLRAADGAEPAGCYDDRR